MDFSLLRSRLQTRLRSMNVSYECLTPVILLPAFIYTAALGRELSIVVFLAMPVLFCVLHRRYTQMQYRSRFFYVWTLWSVIFGYMLFQSTVPMMEVLPEENIVFLLCLVLTIFLFYKTKSHAFSKAYWPTATPTMNGKGAGTSDGDEEDAADSAKLLAEKPPLEDVEAAGNATLQSHATTAGNRVYQCTICQMGVPELDHHNVWLDCCIGASNRKFYLLGCIMAVVTLLLEANLSLTSICHPHLIADIFGVHILMPDDCSDVYDQYE